MCWLHGDASRSSRSPHCSNARGLLAICTRPLLPSAAGSTSELPRLQDSQHKVRPGPYRGHLKDPSRELRLPWALRASREDRGCRDVPVPLFPHSTPGQVNLSTATERHQRLLWGSGGSRHWPHTAGHECDLPWTRAWRLGCWCWSGEWPQPPSACAPSE